MKTHPPRFCQQKEAAATLGAPPRAFSLPSAKHRARGGFAVVATLIFSALLLGLIVLLSSSVIRRQRGANFEGRADSAQESALLGLQVALGELQAAAGPDQRVTATASFLGHKDNGYPAKPDPMQLPPDGATEWPEDQMWPAGRKAWTGVWKSNTVTAPDGEAMQYSPASPDSKSFVGWLVSATDADGNFTLPDKPMDAAAKDTFILERRGDFFELRDPVTLVSSTELDENGDRVPYLQAGKVPIDDPDDADAKTKRYFAFAVEDESVKADLSWSEAPPLPDPDDYLGGATDPQYLVDLEQAKAARLSARLSAAPGPDYAVFNEKHPAHPVPDHEMPFFDTAATYKVAYPLTAEGGTNPFLTEAIGRMRDPADLQTLIDGNALVTHEAWFDMSDWLRDQRAHFTWGSRGVLADVKQGGLRRDLSLAFEMDGDADITASEQPALFNQQVGEFVGPLANPAHEPRTVPVGSENDKNVSTHNPPFIKNSTQFSMPNFERFLFRETRETGGPFADKVYEKTSWLSNRDPSVARGPTWWNLRDYYNLHKRMAGKVLKARAYYPNRSSIGYAHSDLLDTIHTWADHRIPITASHIRECFKTSGSTFSVPPGRATRLYSWVLPLC